MGPEFRATYILEIFLANAPFGILRFYAFRHELRVSARVVLLCYFLIVLGKIVYLNYANWPELLPVDERQRYYLISTAITNLFFFLVIRPFWRHLFVVGVLMIYAMVMLYPFGFLIGNEWMGQGLEAHTAGCVYLLIAYFLTWGIVKSWITEGVVPFFRYGTESFWRFFWLIPLLFVISVVLFGVDTAGRNQLKGAVAVASIVGGLGLAAAFCFMRNFMEYLYENHILKENLGIADEIGRLRLERMRTSADRLQRLRDIRKEFLSHMSRFQEYVKEGNWQDLEQDVKNARRELKQFCGRKDQPDD